MRAVTASVVLGVAVAICFLPKHKAVAADSPAIVREQKLVMVDGKRETWRLEWEAKPTPACGAQDAEVSLTCPCSGFAYGEQGPLALVRIRSNGASERLELGPLFTQGIPAAGSKASRAVLQRQAPQLASEADNDWKHLADSNFAADVARRPVADVMQLADFDHDGQATEFLLQVDTLPCGKHQMVLVGISKAEPHLHVFSSQEKPHEPLILGSWEWEALRDNGGPTDVIDWNCNDHGSLVQWQVHLAADSGLIRARKTSDYCPQVKMSPFYKEFLKLDDLHNRGQLDEQEYSRQFLDLMNRLGSGG